MTKGIKHKDVGEDLSRTEFEADDSHELESGTSFPGSPVEKDRFYRTDLHQWYIYNGTTWKILGGFYALGSVWVVRAIGTSDVSGNDDASMRDQITYAKRGQYTIGEALAGLTIRTCFYLNLHTAYVGLAYCTIYKNGSPFGTERATGATTPQQFTEDLIFAADDTMEAWLKTAEVNEAALLRDFGIKGSIRFAEFLPDWSYYI